MNIFERLFFKFRTGHGIEVVNNGKPVNEVVIKYKEFYFSIMVDDESGEPTNNFYWSRDPMIFSNTPVREYLEATKPFKEEVKDD